MAENNKTPTKKRSEVEQFTTHSGHVLTPKEAKFIDKYIETGNGSKSVEEAGYKSKNPRGYAQTLLTKEYIASEINYRLSQLQSESIATADEIMQYFTDVMRGKIADQFGLEAPLSERTKAAQELAKRQIDIPNKLKGNTEEPTLTIKLDWGQDLETPPVKPNITLDGLSD